MNSNIIQEVCKDFDLGPAVTEAPAAPATHIPVPSTTGPHSGLLVLGQDAAGGLPLASTTETRPNDAGDVSLRDLYAGSSEPKRRTLSFLRIGSTR